MIIELLENQINAIDAGKKEDQRKDSRSMQSNLKLAYGHFTFQRKSFGLLSISFYTVNILSHINIHIFSHHDTVFLILRKNIAFPFGKDIFFNIELNKIQDFTIKKETRYNC